MQAKHLSALSPRWARRGTKFVAGGIALAVGTFGGLAAITALPAYAFSTNNYTIGSPTGVVTGVTVSPTSALASATDQSYTVTFTSPAALSYSVPDTITIGDSTTGNTVADTASSVDVISGTCLQSGDDTTSTSYGFRITLTSSACSIPAGATVEVTFDATDPTANFNFTVYTSENSTAANSPTVTINSVPPTLSAASESSGVNTTWTIDDIGASGASGGAWSSLTASFSTIEIVSSNVGTDWYSGTAGYTVTETPSGGSATSDAVTGVAIGTAANAGTPTDTVFLTVTNAIANDSTVNITALVTNPASGFANVSLTPGNISSSVFTEVGGGTTESTPVDGLSFGSAVTAVTASPSPAVANDTATYTVTFKATTCVGTSSCTTGAGDIFIEESTGPTNFSGANTSSGGILVNDTTAGWHYVVPVGGATVPSSDEIEVPLGGNTINAGDTVTVTLVDVVNPANGTYSDFDVWTAGDPIATPAPTYAINASGTSGVNVSVSPSTVGSVATYTVTGLYASGAITGGSSGEPGNEIELTAPSGTVFPDNGADFLVTDSTTSSGSGTFSLVTYNAANFVTLSPPNNINSGDLLTITVSDVINPSTSSSTDNLTITGPVEAQTGVAPFPDANVTYPNGSIIDFAGTDYVFAGGHPFGIATPTLLLKLEAVDHATVLKAASGALLPTAAPRPGTLITTNAINANATIYVVGNDGQLHGFATGAQYLGDGFDPALAVTVPNMGGLTVGSTAGAEGASANALATSADGAVVDSSGTYYVFDGSKAFGIPTPAALQVVRKTDDAVALTGTIGTTQTGATFATGALLTLSGTVYVGYVGDVFPFKSSTQFGADGYAGTASITVPNIGGLPVVTTYSGS
ncbi:MAG TPA: hypothetical protein VME46_10590 [Acidimicrobiales bacterium]|nr:hypothetical protein [Acidimicrobiales bacterium]